MFTVFLCLLLFLFLTWAITAFELEVDCAEGDDILFAALEFTPCQELLEQSKEVCLETTSCVLTNFTSHKCIKYARGFPERIFECVPKSEESLFQIPTISFNPFMRYFSLAIDTCIESAYGDSLETILENTLDKSARFFGEFTPPTILEKSILRQIGEDLWLKNWQKAFIAAKQLGIRPCRVHHEGYDVFLLLPPEEATRYSGPVMAMRIDAPSPIVLHPSRHDSRVDNLNHLIQMFSMSDTAGIVFQPYSPMSSLEKDPCQTDWRITEGTHSMEAPIFHLMVGLSDAFPVLVYMESEDCTRCTAVIGRGMDTLEVDGDVSSSYILTHLHNVNEMLRAATTTPDGERTKTMYADVQADLLEDSPYSVTPSKLGAFHSKFSVLGRYLHESRHMCEVLANPVTVDSNRYISIQRETRTLKPDESKAAGQVFVQFLERIADSEFMRNRVGKYGVLGSKETDSSGTTREEFWKRAWFH